MLYSKFLLALAFLATFANVAFSQDQQGDGGNGGDNNGDQGNNAQNGQNNRNGQNNQNGQGGQGTQSTAVATTDAAGSTNTATATTGGGGGGGNGNGGDQAVLNPANIQDASNQDGQGAQASGVKAGQAASETDAANFINFCTGKDITNGLQKKGGSCNGVVMGDIPATTNMVSTILTNPAPGACIAANQDFDVTLQVANLNAGVFTNPDVTYYTAPQGLKGGNIIGHVHVTVQTLGNSLTPQQAPDASTFAFFKGIDDAGDGNGGLKATVAGGLPAGNYRVCTMSAAANHQPVIMPVAQRGAQDDCTKFTVADNCQANGGNANGGNANGGNDNGGNNNGGNGGNGATTSSAAAGGSTGTTTTAAAGTASTSTAAAANNGGQFGQGGQRGQGGRGRFGQRRHRYANRPWVV